jgi:hypothetical protein
MPSNDAALNAPPSRRRGAIPRRASLTALLAVVATAVTVLGGTGLAQAARAEYVLECPEKSYSFRETTSPNGAVLRHHELRSGDIADNDKKYTDGRQRCEMIGRTEYPLQTNLWFAYSFRWTGEMPGGDRNWNVMTQLRQPLESGEPAGKPPAFTMRHVRGNLELATRSDTRKTTDTQVDEVVRRTLPWFPANTWQRIVVRVKFDPFGKGNITFWLNGQKVYASGQIPIGYNDSFGPHFSQGQYRGATDATTALDFANVEFGTKSLLDRVTQPKPLPN